MEIKKGECGHYRLHVACADLSPHTHTHTNTHRTILGRSPACALVMDNFLVSRQHAEIEFVSEATKQVEYERMSENGKYKLDQTMKGMDLPFFFTVTDVSTNGTYINKRPLVKHSPRVLRNGDKIVINNDVVATFVLG